MQPALTNNADPFSFSDKFSLATEFIVNTNQNIFLTGKAGTGKTTFLKYIRGACNKELAVTAPTGVAAINCGGSTLHSLFQLPFGCYIPGELRGFTQTNVSVTDKQSLFRNLKINNDKKELFANLQLLIIDEVSMLRCDMLDAIDAILRRFRKNILEPFGGVQVLFIGDLYQLPPVVTDEEWQYLGEYYRSPFFFEAQALQEHHPVCIELDTVYRQTDIDFIHLLNRIRNNEVMNEDYSLLQSLYKPYFQQRSDNPYITLTTHNYKADDINKRELQKIAAKEYLFEALVKNDFPERMYPVEKTLTLKEGTRIMFIKNDSKEKRWYNGKLATVQKIEHDEETDAMLVKVLPDGDQYPLYLEKEEWKNIRYVWNEEEHKIKEEEMGSFTQYPIRLAWAITIHKSQGLTFPKAIIDAGAAFAAGQVYVALSRCVSLQGVVLLSAIAARAINTDERIVAYMHKQSNAVDYSALLSLQKEKYFISRTLQLYNWENITERMKTFIEYMMERQLEVKLEVITQLQKIHEDMIVQKETADKFMLQIRSITDKGLNEEVTQILNMRLEKANTWFAKETEEKILNPIQKINKDLMNQKKVKTVLKAMGQQILFYEKLYNRFVPAEKRKGRRYTAPATQQPAAENKIQGPLEFLASLRRLRQGLAMKENIPPYRVCNDATLTELADYLPQNINEMADIRGMGDYTLNKYGEVFLNAVLAYSKANSLESRMHLKKEKMLAQPKTQRLSEDSSMKQTLMLYTEGKTIPEIAQQRNLAVSTIEGHLALLVKHGEIDALKLLSEEKYNRIAEALAENAEPGIVPVKNKLGDYASFSEIRYVLNDLERKKAVTQE